MTLRTRLIAILALALVLMAGSAVSATAVTSGGVRYVSGGQRHAVTISEVDYLRRAGWVCQPVTTANYVCVYTANNDVRIVSASATHVIQMSEVAYLTQHGWSCRLVTRLVYQCRQK